MIINKNLFNNRKPQIIKRIEDGEELNESDAEF